MWFLKRQAARAAEPTRPMERVSDCWEIYMSGVDYTCCADDEDSPMIDSGCTPHVPPG